MLSAVLVLLRWLPKITLFYFLLTKLGLAQYSLLLLMPALALDAVDYTSLFD